MLEIFNKWYRRYLFEEESVLLLVLLTIGVVLLMTIGDSLTPVLASVVLAYLMQGLANRLQRIGLPQWLGVSLAYLVFLSIFFGVALGLLPLVWRQMISLVGETPRMLDQLRQFLEVLPERYPEMVNRDQLETVVDLVKDELAGLGQTAVARSPTWIPGIFTVVIYMVLIPMLVFFFLRDRQQILAWVSNFLPRERPLLRRLWGEMDMQFANYARGKVVEIIVVGAVSYLCFAFLGLKYAALLGLLVGLSVIIPYIGAVLVTVPVLMVGFFQWGLASDFYYLLATYLVIQGVDGNVLVPLLFSEAVNLHPVAIIVAILFFGGIWGLWGVFFAIPLATLIKAIINAWPEPQSDQVAAPELNTHN
jgi:putative permease